MRLGKEETEEVREAHSDFTHLQREELGKECVPRNHLNHS